MSEIMLNAVLRMPPELWSNEPLDIMQRHSRYVEAADELDRLRAIEEMLTRYLRVSTKLYASLKHTEEYKMLVENVPIFKEV